MCLTGLYNYAINNFDRKEVDNGVIGLPTWHRVANISRIKVWEDILKYISWV